MKLFKLPNILVLPLRVQLVQSLLVSQALRHSKEFSNIIGVIDIFSFVTIDDNKVSSLRKLRNIGI